MLVHISSEQTSSSLDIFTKDQVQPNAIDLRLDKVYKERYDSSFTLTEEIKEHREKLPVLPNKNGIFVLHPKTSYEVVFEGIVTVGPDEAGFVITRSSLNRNGLFITSGLYDSGYKGAMAGAIHNLSSGYAYIGHGTRVGQFILWKAEALHEYNGSYGITKDGVIKEEEKRYHNG